MTTETFRPDNTDGYTAEQLAELNRRFAEARGHEIEDKSERDRRKVNLQTASPNSPTPGRWESFGWKVYA